jgi:archaellum component FlaC
MAAAQLLKITNTIDNRVGKVADNILGVDNRVAGIGDQVQGVDDKVTAVMDGARYIFYPLS